MTEIILKRINMANCSEKADLGRCCYCDNDANNKSEFNPDMIKEKQNVQGNEQGQQLVNSKRKKRSVMYQ